ncbi:zinc finger protein, putative [Plasmodium gallinaceum]|uniref:Zinc finger protein, putative n=1 Tax=Plasmodium gallinaceum TaxID=5849 RepID=A0A1J1GUX1_PLAGA|nr:zinc finger protein, putative [Plasmodium gallinaceum]CRG94841.1 zinc finger protein, putative [Plasmodium gallinaceum]
MVLSSRKKKNPRNTIKSKILKTRKRKRDFDEVYKDYFNKPDLPHDEDLKGCGQFKCFACDIYFINNDAMKQHEKTKKHKRRVKLLNKEKVYTYKDSLKAAEITF